MLKKRNHRKHRTFFFWSFVFAWIQKLFFWVNSIHFIFHFNRIFWSLIFYAPSQASLKNAKKHFFRHFGKCVILIKMFFYVKKKKHPIWPLLPFFIRGTSNVTFFFLLKINKTHFLLCNLSKPQKEIRPFSSK